MTYEDLIRRLSEHWGMSWAQVARVAELPVSRIRAWAYPGSDNIPEEAIARLQLLDRWLNDAADAGSPEPVYELDRRLVNGYTATGWDLYCNGEGQALLRIVAGQNATAVLDDTFVDWRTRFDTAFETFEAEDGHPSIRLKEGYRAPRTY